MKRTQTDPGACATILRDPHDCLDKFLPWTACCRCDDGKTTRPQPRQLSLTYFLQNMAIIIVKSGDAKLTSPSTNHVKIAMQIYGRHCPYHDHDHHGTKHHTSTLAPNGLFLSAQHTEKGHAQSSLHGHAGAHVFFVTDKCAQGRRLGWSLQSQGATSSYKWQQPSLERPCPKHSYEWNPVDGYTPSCQRSDRVHSGTRLGQLCDHVGVAPNHFTYLLLDEGRCEEFWSLHHPVAYPKETNANYAKWKNIENSIIPCLHAGTQTPHLIYPRFMCLTRLVSKNQVCPAMLQNANLWFDLKIREGGEHLS